MQRNWIGRSKGARVMFRVDGSGEELPVFTTRPDTLFGATFFVLAPEHPLVAAARCRLRARGGGARLRAPQRCALGGRARGEGEGRRLHGALRGQSRQRRGDPDLGRRLRPDGLRDGRDHGRARARRARPRLRGALRHRDPAGRASRRWRRARDGGAFSAHTENEVLVNSGEFDGLPSPEAKERDRRLARRARSRGGDDRLPPARLAALAPALLGLPDPDRPLSGRAARSPVPDDQLPVVLPEIEDYLPKGRSPLAAAEDWVDDDMPDVRRPRQARDGHDGHLRRLVVVLHPLHRPDERHGCRSTARSPTTGCRSTSTSAASSTRSCTCSTRASSRR